MVVGTALISCADLQPTANAPQTPQVSYEPFASVDRRPLAPPAGYASAPAQATDAPTQSVEATGYGSEQPTTGDVMGWKRSRRWAASRSTSRSSSRPIRPRARRTVLLPWHAQASPRQRTALPFVPYRRDTHAAKQRIGRAASGSERLAPVLTNGLCPLWVRTDVRGLASRCPISARSQRREMRKSPLIDDEAVRIWPAPGDSGQPRPRFHKFP